MNKDVCRSSLRFLVIDFFFFVRDEFQAAAYKVLLGNRRNAPTCRRDVRLNDVNRCLVATSLLGNSRYQADRNRDLTKAKSHFACDPRVIRARQHHKLAFARK